MGSTPYTFMLFFVCVCVIRTGVACYIPMRCGVELLWIFASLLIFCNSSMRSLVCFYIYACIFLSINMVERVFSASLGSPVVCAPVPYMMVRLCSYCPVCSVACLVRAKESFFAASLCV